MGGSGNDQGETEPDRVADASSADSHIVRLVGELCGQALAGRFR